MESDLLLETLELTGVGIQGAGRGMGGDGATVEWGRKGEKEKRGEERGREVVEKEWKKEVCRRQKEG